MRHKTCFLDGSLACCCAEIGLDAPGRYLPTATTPIIMHFDTDISDVVIVGLAHAPVTG